MKSVSHIFGSEAKVKIMRLFIFNPAQIFPAKEVSKRSQVDSSKVRMVLQNLVKAGLIKKRARGYLLDASYRYLAAIENFLIDAAPVSEREIIRKVAKAGHLKLVSISGIFLHDRDSRVDILVVGDHLQQSKLVSSISSIEAELGKEIRYAAFETADFNYRLGIYDKLIRDILDFPHRKILDKLGLEQSTGVKN
jgi:hypothetical protein